MTAGAIRSAQRSRAPAGAGRVAAVVLLAVVAGGAALCLANLVLARAGLGFEPMRSRQDADEMLVRREFRTHVVTNALGFRERRMPGPAAPGTLRVVALGDSFTQGYGVADGERFTDLLERALARRDARPVEVINLGVPGATVPDYLYHLRDVGLRYAPDVVLIGFMANDVNDVRGLLEQHARGILGTLRRIRTDATDTRPPWKRWAQQLWPVVYDVAGTRWNALGAASGPHVAEAVTGPPGARASHVPASEAQWRRILLDLAERYGRRAQVAAAVDAMDAQRRARLRDVVTGRWHFEEEIDQTPLWELYALVEPEVFVDSVLLPPSYDDAWRETAARLVETVDVARRAGARPVVVFMPGAQQVMPEERAFLAAHGFAWDERLLTDTTFADRVRALGERNGFPVIDLLPALRQAAATAPLYFVEDGHWTPAGHAVAAAEIARELPPA